MRFIVQSIFSGTGVLANVEIVIRQVQLAFTNVRQELTITVERGIEAGFKHLFGLGRRRPELQNLERTELGNQFEEEGEKTLARAGLAIVLAPFALIICAGQIEQKLFLRCVWNVVLDLVFLEVPGNASGFRNELADIAAVRVESFVFAHQHIFQLEPIRLPKSLFRDWSGNVWTEEVVRAVRSVAFPRDFKNVKAKFGFHMCKPVVFKRNGVAEFLPEARIQERNGSIDAQAVSVIVRGVMGERADSESVRIEIFRLAQQSLDEIAATDIMREVAEKGAAIRVITHILNNGAAVSVALRPAQIFFGCLREFFQEERLDVRFPSRIDDGFMREDSIAVNGRRQRQQRGGQANDDKTGATGEAGHVSTGRWKMPFRRHV